MKMNKYKVLVNDYRKALLIDNKIREGKIEKKIKSILKYFCPLQHLHL